MGERPDSDVMRVNGADESIRADAVWERLAANSDHSDPFSCGPAWQRSCLAAFREHAPLYVRHDEERIAAFALHGEGGRSPYLGPLDCSWLFGCPLLGPGADELLLDLIAELSGNVSAVLISGLQRSDPNAMWMLLDLTARTSDQTTLHVRDTTMAQASLQRGYDGYWSRRAPKFLRDIRRCRRRASDEGVTFERSAPRDADAVREVYRRMCAIDERSWKDREGHGIGGRDSRHFYLHLLESLSVSGAARVVFARACDHDVGFIFGGISGTVYRGQQFSFDEAWYQLSIGSLLQDQMIAWLCEDGVQRYDLGPRMPYMSRWAESSETQSAYWLQF
jgi:hypothetical protein